MKDDLGSVEREVKAVLGAIAEHLESQSRAVKGVATG